jgi:hypothetical protein
MKITDKDIEKARIEGLNDAIKYFCSNYGISDLGDISDGYHTFNQLYHQRCVLFAALCNTFKDIAWKSHRHEDGEKCFGKDGWFIVGIDTPEGSYTYHYEDKYWDMFHCHELEVGKKWDGHTEKDVTRLLSLSNSKIWPVFMDYDPARENEKIKAEKKIVNSVYGFPCNKSSNPVSRDLQNAYDKQVSAYKEREKKI